MQYRFEGLDVLVVDDNVQMRNYLKSILEIFRAGRIRGAADGGEAASMIRADPPDLVLTDLQMAPMNGIELVRWLRNGPDSPDRFIPAIMITASSEASELAAARDAGIHDILFKPATLQALGRSIDAVVNDPPPFIRTRNYFGPERRRAPRPFAGQERRVPVVATRG